MVWKTLIHLNHVNCNNKHDQNGEIFIDNIEINYNKRIHLNCNNQHDQYGEIFTDNIEINYNNPNK